MVNHFMNVADYGCMRSEAGRKQTNESEIICILNELFWKRSSSVEKHEHFKVLLSQN